MERPRSRGVRSAVSGRCPPRLFGGRRFRRTSRDSSKPTLLTGADPRVVAAFSGLDYLELLHGTSTRRAHEREGLEDPLRPPSWQGHEVRPGHHASAGPHHALGVLGRKRRRMRRQRRSDKLDRDRDGAGQRDGRSRTGRAAREEVSADGEHVVDRHPRAGDRWGPCPRGRKARAGFWASMVCAYPVEDRQDAFLGRRAQARIAFHAQARSYAEGISGPRGSGSRATQRSLPIGHPPRHRQIDDLRA